LPATIFIATLMRLAAIALPALLIIDMSLLPLMPLSFRLRHYCHWPFNEPHHASHEYRFISITVTI
jgi:hypothetical protein